MGLIVRATSGPAADIWAAVNQWSPCSREEGGVGNPLSPAHFTVSEMEKEEEAHLKTNRITSERAGQTDMEKTKS